MSGDGIDLKAQGFYKTKAWQRARLLALQRDHYLCQKCLDKKRIKKATEVHHIKPIKHYPEKALDLENLQSLCKECHEATKYGGAARCYPARVITMGAEHGEADAASFGKRER